MVQKTLSLIKWKKKRKKKRKKNSTKKKRSRVSVSFGWKWTANHEHVLTQRERWKLKRKSTGKKNKIKKKHKQDNSDVEKSFISCANIRTSIEEIQERGTVMEAWLQLQLQRGKKYQRYVWVKKKRNSKKMCCTLYYNPLKSGHPS